MNQTLMKRAEDQIALWQLIESTGGELNETLEKWLTEIETNLSQKVDAYKVTLDDLESEAERLRKRAQEFTQAARAIEGVQDRIKDRMKYVMQKLGVDKIEGENYKFTLYNSKPSLVIDEALLPRELFMQKIEIVPDKERIKNAMDRGEFFAGAEYKPTLAIRSSIKKGK